MLVRCFLFLAAFMIYIPEFALAYEVETHGRMTFEAFSRSDIDTYESITRLGIEINKESPFGEDYFDTSGNKVEKRSADKGAYLTDIFELELNLSAFDWFRIPGWLMRGAIREDDYTPRNFPCEVKPRNPQDDPYGNIDRSPNHFFDPVNNREITVGLDPRETAVNWALGSSDVFAASPTENAGRRNHFTVLDAREAMFRALTGQRLTDPVKNIGPGDTGSAPANAAEAETFRKAYWATTFRALGDVMHLIEDMAQPQHTRNDPHTGACSQFVQDIVTGRESVYEVRMKARTLSGIEYNSANASKTQLGGLVYNGYPIPSFNRYSDFFSTQPGGDVTIGRGLADYSNRGFFTVRSLPKSFSNTLNNYQNPPNDPNNGFYTESLQKPDPNDFAESRYLEGQVNDSLTNTPTTIPLVVEGLLRAELVNEDVPAADINNGTGIYPHDMTYGALRVKNNRRFYG